jgi:hypothetical protein
LIQASKEKIAVLLSGQSRNALSQYHLNKDFFQGENVDVFIHSWCEPFRISLKNKSPGRESDRRIIFPRLSLRKIYKPVKIIVERPKSFKDRDLLLTKDLILNTHPWADRYSNEFPKFTQYLLANNLSMWYSINKCFRLMEDYSLKNNIPYKLVMRMRFDVFPKKIPKIFESSQNNWVMIQNMDLPKGMINDWFAVGDYQGMKNYCSVFDNINDLFYRVISSHKSWCNEHALYEMLKVRNTSVNFTDFELKWDKLNYKSKMLNYLKY